MSKVIRSNRIITERIEYSKGLVTFLTCFEIKISERKLGKGQLYMK